MEGASPPGKAHVRGRRSLGQTETLKQRDRSVDRQLSAKTKTSRASSICSSGDACPFSHDVPGSGQGKTICAWYVKGSCRFGHKCALAHVMPGEPLSNDRKNKRAQQLAQREAAQKEMETRNPNLSGQVVEVMSTNGSALVDEVFVAEQGSSRPMDYAAIVAGTQQAHLQRASLSQGPGRPLMSPHAIPSPIAMEQLGRQASQQSSLHSGSPVFSTSPFSPPGTTSVFFSGSLGSDEGGREGAFGGAAARRGASPMRRNGLSHSLNGVAADENEDNAFAHESDDDAGYEGLGNSRHEEDCLPSSLSDLMTPDEIQRRHRKMHPLLKSAADGLSRSVPHAPLPPSPSTSLSSSADREPSMPLHPLRSMSPGSATPHAAGSSLPGGLAAGLSRLHLQAPRHTGETPISSRGTSPMSTPSGGLTTVKGNNAVVGSPLARSAWPHLNGARSDDKRSPSALKETASSFDGDEMPFELEV